jgi:hypothetical protein
VADILISLWREMLPYIGRFVQLIAPVFVLLFFLGILHRLSSVGNSSFDVSKFIGDLPSVLALIIIVTICLLPIAGFGIPDVLNNIALVVVGFYFGKRKNSDD